MNFNFKNGYVWALGLKIIRILVRDRMGVVAFPNYDTYHKNVSVTIKFINKIRIYKTY